MPGWNSSDQNDKNWGQQSDSPEVLKAVGHKAVYQLYVLLFLRETVDEKWALF